MIIKVCGMRDEANILDVSALDIDWMGFIFYPKSPRYISDDKDNIRNCRVKKVGVFVNAAQEQIMEIADGYKLDYIQLHGNESPDFCHTLQKRGFNLIKAFSIANKDDIKQTETYNGRVDYFLFDTKCDSYGGSGKSFDWKVLEAYNGDTPFLLSGGINMNSVEHILDFKHPLFRGIDLNSGFETQPGLKDVMKLNSFINRISSIR